MSRDAAALSKSRNQYDVIIVGAGMSGLTATYRLKKKYPDVSLVLLEANDRYGGRTHTVPLKAASGSDMFDLGGQWVASRSQPHVMRIIEELGLVTYRQFLDGKSIQQFGGTDVKTYKGTIPKLSPFALVELAWVMWKQDRLLKQIDVNDPYSHPKAEEWDSISVRHFIDQNMRTQEAKETFVMTVRMVLGQEGERVSLLFYLMYIRMAEDFDTLVEDTEGCGQESLIKGGTESIRKGLLATIGTENMKLSHPVQSVTQNDSGVTVVTKSGWTGTASRIILAMPPPAIDKIEFSPRLPMDRVDFTKHMHMGLYTKILVTYPTAFWREKGLTGFVASSGHPLSDKHQSAPISAMYDTCTYDKNPALLGFIAGKNCVEWAMKSDEERKKGVIEHLVSLYGKEAENCLDYAEKHWNQEPYIMGGPVGSIGVGAMKHYGDAIRRVEGRIHFAGTETATCWMGYINGAVQAGERTALEVLSHIQSKTLNDQERLLLQERETVQRRMDNRRKKAGTGGGIGRKLCYVSFGVAIASALAYAASVHFGYDVGQYFDFK